MATLTLKKAGTLTQSYRLRKGVAVTVLAGLIAMMLLSPLRDFHRAHFLRVSWWEIVRQGVLLLFVLLPVMTLYGVVRNRRWGRWFGQGLGISFWVMCCMSLPELYGWLTTAACFLLFASLSGPVMARKYEDAGSRHHFLNSGTRQTNLLKAALVLTVAVNPALVLGSGWAFLPPIAAVGGLMAATQLAGAYYTAREKTAGLFLMAATMPGLLAMLIYLQGSVGRLQETKVLHWLILASVALTGFFLWCFARPMWLFLRRPVDQRTSAKLPAFIVLLALVAPIFVLTPLFAARSIRRSLPSQSDNLMTEVKRRAWSLKQSWGEIDFDTFRKKVANTKMPEDVRAVLEERIVVTLQRGDSRHEAVAYLKRLLKERPGVRTRKRQLMLADLLYEIGNIREATFYFRQALATAPPGVYDLNPDATFLLYHVSLKEGRYWNAFMHLARFRPREDCGWYYREMYRARRLIGLFWKGIFQSIFGF